MTRTFEAYLIRLVPVRSAPAYVHQLQTNPTIFGSNSATSFTPFRAEEAISTEAAGRACSLVKPWRSIDFDRHSATHVPQP